MNFSVTPDHLLLQTTTDLRIIVSYSLMFSVVRPNQSQRIDDAVLVLDPQFMSDWVLKSANISLALPGHTVLSVSLVLCAHMCC